MDLAGKLLIAMPGMGDPRFEQSVVFMCAHSESGAMGLIVNKPATEMRFSKLLQQLGITPHADARDIRVQIGGPVEHGRGFVLHTPDYQSEPGMQLADGRFAMTATLDILQALADGAGPERSFLALGYAGVYSSFLRHSEAASEKYGIPAFDILIELGRRRMVGGQEDMIVDVALDMLKARASATKGAGT